jgi:DNA-binding NarL/FixJ family response regulator
MTRSQLLVELEKRVVWIIEDNAQFGRQLSSLLNLSNEFHCSQTLTACEPALDLLRDDVLPDIILMDLGLPGMNGIEGIREIKVLAPVVNVVVLTVFEDSETIVQAISAGASGYLLKSSSLDTTIDALKTILFGGAPMSPQVAKKILGLFSNTARPNPEYNLSKREKQILTFLVDGLIKKEIAAKLDVSFHTIDHHLRNIYSKLHVQSRSGAVAKALKEKLL